jgi:calcineurin-like phosphoesterase family protein
MAKRQTTSSRSRPQTSAAVVLPVRNLSSPVFAQPEPTADPSIFKIKHPSDAAAYHAIDELNKLHKIQAMPFPKPRGNKAEPRLTLHDVFGGDDAATKAIAAIEGNQQIVFHSTGDCGSTRGPTTQNEVTDKMIGDFNETEVKEMPQFALLLGDIVYSFGETEYYFDQFYEPYRNYHAPVLAAAGNHDGMISPLAHAKSLDGYLRNFCCDPTKGFAVMPEAGKLSRTAQIQPGVFFTFEAPFVRILVFYSNTLEDPGVIADNTIGHDQIDFLRAALQRVKAERYEGALLFAHHHPQYAIGGQHSSSTEMRQQMDAVCAEVGVWPHAVLTGHAHSYQRFTRCRADGTEIPYLICGNGGHNVQKLRPVDGKAPRVPQTLQAKTRDDDQVVFERYDDTDYGYLRVIATAQQLRIEYHPASDGVDAKTPDDSVTIDLASRKRTTYSPSALGITRMAGQVRALHTRQVRARRQRQERARAKRKS